MYQPKIRNYHAINFVEVADICVNIAQAIIPVNIFITGWARLIRTRLIRSST